MRALALFAVAIAAGCGAGGGDVASAELALSASDLPPSDVAAIEILVFDVAHALFTLDGTPKHLAIPAGKALDFYAEAFRTTAPNRARVGRGCVSQTLAAGGAATVSIAINANDP